MKKLLYSLGLMASLILIVIGCSEESYEFGDLTTPSNLTINADIVGADASSPDGDGSGVVNITVSANNAITYHIGFTKIENYPGDVSFQVVSTGVLTKKFTDPGVNTYRVSVVAYGAGGTAANATTDITVRSDYIPPVEVVTALTNDSSKAWIVDKDVPAHFGVDDYSKTEYTSTWWWSAGVDEKLDCCSCFYSTTFTFVKGASGYTLNVDAPDGAFTKTGDLSGGLPGIPDSGDEGCYTEYTGGSSSFALIPSASPISADTSTKVAIKLDGTETFIGYGATQKEYEILEINSDYMFLRVQGTETGNSWYLKLKPAP